jgi:hypothetical protein
MTRLRNTAAKVTIINPKPLTANNNRFQFPRNGVLMGELKSTPCHADGPGHNKTIFSYPPGLFYNEVPFQVGPSQERLEKM